MPDEQKRRAGGPDGLRTEHRPSTPQKQAGNGTLPAAAQPAESATIDLVELMYRLLGNWKLIAGLAVGLAVIMGVYTSFFVTPMYEATSIIYVLSNRDSAINVSDLQLGSELTQDYIKVFHMWEVHEQVISNLGLSYSYSQMQNMLSVSNDTDTRMLDITVTSADPQEAADVANEYAQVASQYIAETMATDKPNIMSVALVPSNPVSPNKTRNILLGFLLGGILAAGIVTVRMLVDDKYKTAEDIRRYTGLATLAVVPVENGSAAKNKKRARGGREI